MTGVLGEFGLRKLPVGGSDKRKNSLLKRKVPIWQVTVLTFDALRRLVHFELHHGIPVRSGGCETLTIEKGSMA